MSLMPPPLAILAELTHRCPLRCPYCSNPVELARAREELSTDEWIDLMRQAAAIGVLQVHLSGGEPTVRKDLERIVAAAREIGIYTNLITSAVLLDQARVEALAAAGLDHVQISFQDSEPGPADRIGGYAGGHANKRAVAAWVRAAGLPLTVNLVVHRQNLSHLGAMIEMAASMDARRIEVAHVQYYGWGLVNRAALVPTRAQVAAADDVVAEARARLEGRAVIDYVVPDYYARRPKPCMGGWARQFLTVTPAGKVLPCHAADSIPGLAFESIRERPLAEIWESSEAFRRFRGTDWMPEPCRSCDRREIDWGGCRCQAFALVGDAAATDPACGLSPHHERIAALAARESEAGEDLFLYRSFASVEEARVASPLTRDRGRPEAAARRAPG
jgi:pyrroloquinoline quinone biosynthesis protein E